MRQISATIVLIALQSVASCRDSAAGLVEFQEGFESGVHFVDVFHTLSAGSEPGHYEFLVSPMVGGLLDPVRNLAGNAGDYDNVTDGARLDTWVNTPFTSIGAGAPTILFYEYNPGSPPSTMPEALPTHGGSPDQLFWVVLDTNTFEGYPEPFHIARFLYTTGGYGRVAVRAFDTVTYPTGGELFSTSYGIPEPASGVLAAFGLLGRIALRRPSA